MISLTLALGLTVSLARAADSPQFRGPNRDGVFPEKGLLKQWPDGGPKLLWSVNGLGKGWSSASVAGDTLYVTGMARDLEGKVFAFTLDGKLKWQASYGKEDPARNRAGARTTPTVAGDRLYLMSSTGHLVCLDAKTGDKRFDVDTLDRFGGKQLTFAIAESPLIVGDNVIVTPGGPDASLVALNKITGDTVWTTKGLGEVSCYCSATLVKRGNRQLIVTQLKGLIVGVDAADGTVLWKRPLSNRFAMKATSPVCADGKLYVTATQAGGVMLELSADGSAVTEKWTDKTLDCQKEGVVIVDGHLYGTGRNQLVCLELATGKVKWTAKEPGQAVVLAAEGMLYVYSSDGVMRLIKANPDKYQPVSSFEITEGDGEHWAHPALANGRLYVRHGDTLMAYNVSAG